MLAVLGYSMHELQLKIFWFATFLNNRAHLIA